MSLPDLFLAIDVGTGSVRSALVDANGEILAIHAKEHDQIVPRPGWSEQRPRDWWGGAVETTRAVLNSMPGAAERLSAVAACGQMHGTVLIDKAVRGHLSRDRIGFHGDINTGHALHNPAEHRSDHHKCHERRRQKLECVHDSGCRR